MLGQYRLQQFVDLLLNRQRYQCLGAATLVILRLSQFATIGPASLGEVAHRVPRLKFQGFV